MEVRLSILALPILANLCIPWLRRHWCQWPWVIWLSHGAFFAYSLYLLLQLSEQSLILAVPVFGWRLRLFADQMTAASLIIVSLVCMQTILSTPRLWSYEDGFSYPVVFSIHSLALVGLLLSDNLLWFLLLWTILDLCSLRKMTRLRRTMLLQSVSFAVLGAVAAFSILHGSPMFSQMPPTLTELSPPVITWGLALVFLAVGVKGAGFSSSLWAQLAVDSDGQWQSIPLVHGISSVLPCIYLLTRVYPLLELSLWPPMILVALAITIGFVLFPTLDRLHDGT